jgi:hypothetical protein
MAFWHALDQNGLLVRPIFDDNVECHQVVAIDYSYNPNEKNSS